MKHSSLYFFIKRSRLLNIKLFLYMIKILHYIKVGEFNLSDQELSNLESWKRVYPDFKVMYWSDENIMDLIDDCEYIKGCYNTKYYGYVSDYVRIKVTNIYGGMYMDTDVWCVNRIPDKYFEQPFIPWSNEYGTMNTSTGTAIYNSTPNNPLFEKMLDKYRALKWTEDYDSLNAAKINNKYIDSVIAENCGFKQFIGRDASLYDQYCDGMQILNRAQFGFSDFRAELPSINHVKDQTVYLQHNCLGSWGVKNIYAQCNITYFMINEDTDCTKISDWINLHWNKSICQEKKQIILLFINCTDGHWEDLVIGLHMLIPKDTFDMGADATWKVVYLGDGTMSEEEKLVMINNYIITRTPYIMTSKEIIL